MPEIINGIPTIPSSETCTAHIASDDPATALNTTHRSSDGSDHSKVSANETAIGLNTTHRGLNHDYTHITGNDGATDVTAAELEELTDGSETTKHSHADSFVDRGDPAAVDWHAGTIGLINSTWQTLDLSGVVPAAAAGNLVLFQINYQPVGVGHLFQMREKGNSNDKNVFAVQGIVANGGHSLGALVLCDSNREIEYYCTTGATQILVTIRGWWI
jgi:hypothetical protein